MHQFLCGDRKYSAAIPPERVRAVVASRPPEVSDSPDDLVDRALQRCSAQLDNFRAGERVVIVTSDITRYTGSEVYLPRLVSRLNERGIGDEDLEIVVALGIHRKQTEEEHRKIVGELYGRIRVTDHDCDDAARLVEVGTTSAGIPVRLNRTVVEADRLILTGAVTFHYFAGFGGGRKSILPGVAARESCLASHFALLNPGEGSGKSPFARAGNLAGNPVHQAMQEACALCPPDFILNTVVSPGKGVCAVFAGPWQETHLEACRYYADHFTFPISAPAELVVVSCGGFPKDINLIQAHKSMEYASRALKSGGVMVLLAGCRDGYGNATFFDWFSYATCAELESALRKRYEINGQTAWSVKEKAERFRIVLVSSLPDHEVRTMGMTPAPDLESALELAQQWLPGDFTCYLMPQGGTVLPVVRGVSPEEDAFTVEAPIRQDATAQAAVAF